MIADEQAWWQAAAAAQAATTVLCAALTAGFFFNATHRERVPGRRTAALALALTALGAGLQAIAALVWQADPSLVVSTGLPACAGQILTAVLVLRQIGRE